jgi:hypothetical protein
MYVLEVLRKGITGPGTYFLHLSGGWRMDPQMLLVMGQDHRSEESVRRLLH